MIVHHTLDYFTDGSFIRHYFRFITGSFIFISGYIITSGYLKKYHLGYTIFKRLSSRGVKLLAIFAIINFAKDYISDQSFGSNVIIKHFYTVFISGSYQLVAFELLVPIAYVLAFTGIIVLLFRNNMWIIIPVAFMCFFYSSSRFYYLEAGYNFRYFTIGLLGAAFGFIPAKTIQYLHKHWLIITIGYFAYLVYLTFSYLHFPHYFLCILCNLIFLYMVGSKLSPGNKMSGKLLKLGNYTLFSYLVQIPILRILVKLFAPLSYESNEVFIGFVITLIITYASVEITDYMNNNSLIFNKLYRLVFA